MLPLRSPLFRVALTFVLLGLLSLSILFIRNIVTAAWQSDQQEMALYKRSPNCFSHQYASEIDASLPPCQNFTVTVTAKPSTTVIDHRRSGDYPRIHRFLTLRYANGQSLTVGDIYEDLWNSLRVGDPASVVYWHDQVKEVSANGYRSTILDQRSWNNAAGRLIPWIVLGLLSSALVCLIWKVGTRRINSLPFLP